ncbi:MAG: hypothetical protein A2X19_09645 [Bacteroidetes bacterium GWE2_39_28]|nr:MAG: hypothetical protein A2X19_09645 [Bacteroidetes bacterium GWE2_39_28]OFY12348.1 MAG: hypothetical protein A2X16_07120 [Bacteroidetes bacterium GWF2_39_10]OFZ08844.1 MAG: hypothetical protein A2322_07595 [Bacteroidetes bacterium RIFOXYB2_FULL_39_7]OFZ11998.1 MAG: hypothetical protein A2465_08590 [Bacteroidetes bacterium RIFOXYC2_FULL_39_11]HCT95019.1 hypothetical protein [Rikenellaceae bacterium]
MKRPFLLRIVFLVLILPGCTPEEPAKEPPFQLKEFFSGFAQSQLFYSFVADYKPFTSLIEYKNGKVSRVTHKKTISDLEHSSGFGDIVLLDSYHEYSYEGNTVELIWKIDSDKIIYTPIKVKLMLDSRGRVATRIAGKDTTSYYYSERGELSKSITHGNGQIITRDFFYDTNDNLVRINGLRETNRGFVYHIFEYFENYDTAINGFNGLGVIEGALIRSLSRNNFHQYSRSTYDGNNFKIDSLRYRLAVKYDSKGYPIYQDYYIK